MRVLSVVFALPPAISVATRARIAASISRAYKGWRVGPFGCGKSTIAEWPTVLIVSVVPTTFVLGVTDAGLNEHVAIAGSPLHEKN